jgi:roadblock/LC7 domain-containing protein
MKKFFILCLMAFVMCSCNLEQKRIAEKRARFVADSLAKREWFVADSLAKRELFVADSIAKAEHLNAVKKSIQIEGYALQDPNSAGGCDVTIYYRNTVKNKVIKYAVFVCKFYNAVDDEVACEIRGFRDFRGKDTGPINYWEYSGGTWECPIYNWSARKMEIVGIEIDYMDGTELNISAEEMKYVKGYKGRK